MTNATRRALARLLLVPAAALVLAACGSDDDGDAGDATTTSVTSFPTIPPATTAPTTPGATLVPGQTTLAPPSTVVGGAVTFPPQPSTTAAGTAGSTTAGAVAGQYTVVGGDTLSGIANKLAVDFDALLEVNGFTAESLIVPGQKIKVPGAGSGDSGTATTAADVGDGDVAAVGTYTVLAGDYLSGIANKLGVDYDDLLAVNGFTDTSLIVPGQKIKVPGASSGGGGSTATTAPAATTTSSG